MQRIIKIAALLIILSLECFSQTPLNNGLALTVQNGLAITFIGGYTNQTDGASLGTINNSGTVNITGNWTNNSANTVFTSSSGTVVFFDNVAQAIGGTNSTGFNNLTVSNAAGVSLNKAATVADVLTLTSGIVTTTSTNLLTMNAGSSVGAVSSTSFVSGPVAKIGNTDFTFPIGKSAEYRPIAVTSLSGSETFTAQYFHFDPNAANAQDPSAPYNVNSKDVTIDHIDRCEYWILNRATAQNAFVTLSWDNYSCGVNNLADMTVARWDAGTTKWKDHGNGGTTGSVSPATGTVISSTLVSSFGPFALASNNAGVDPLPVELLSFNAKPNGSIVDIVWSTASEFNSSYFLVQRSKDGIVFEDLIQVKAFGNSTTTKNYFTIDYEPYTGISYYRLKQVDNEGKFVLSNTEVVNFKNQELFSVYPNPTSGPFTISISGKVGQEVLIKVRDLLGKEYYSKILMIANDKELIAINPSGKLADGIYFVVVTCNDVIYEKKIVVQ